ILTMQTWLLARRQAVPDATPTGMKMSMSGMEHEMLMPGMLTDEQMKQLDGARGPEFDRLFLTYMIQHHKGAVSMVKDLFDSYGAGQDEVVFKFASDVNVDELGALQQRYPNHQRHVSGRTDAGSARRTPRGSRKRGRGSVEPPRAVTDAATRTVQRRDELRSRFPWQLRHSRQLSRISVLGHLQSCRTGAEGRLRLSGVTKRRLRLSQSTFRVR